MNIRFYPEDFPALLQWAKEEDTTIPNLVKKIIHNAILANEENNETKKTKAIPNS